MHSGAALEYTTCDDSRDRPRRRKKDNKLSAFVLGVVNSPAFKMVCRLG